MGAGSYCRGGPLISVSYLHQSLVIALRRAVKAAASTSNTPYELSLLLVL